MTSASTSAPRVNPEPITYVVDDIRGFEYIGHRFKDILEKWYDSWRSIENRAAVIGTSPKWGEFQKLKIELESNNKDADYFRNQRNFYWNFGKDSDKVYLIYALEKLSNIQLGDIQAVAQFTLWPDHIRFDNIAADPRHNHSVLNPRRATRLSGLGKGMLDIVKQKACEVELPIITSCQPERTKKFWEENGFKVENLRNGFFKAVWHPPGHRPGYAASQCKDDED